jgi:acyl carrier protein
MSNRREEFSREMLAWLNDEVAPRGVRVDADTPLFATRLLDSLKVLELIAFTEQAIGRAIPDSHIRMDNFQTVARIAAVFLPLDDDVAA